jgi:hypothetical protein
MEVSGEIQDPAAFSSEKEPSVSTWIGGWVISSVGVDAAERSHYRESNSDSSACSPSLYRLSYSGFKVNGKEAKIKKQ